METKARYILIGSFVLAVTLAVFAFVYWLHNTGGIGARQDYRIRFESSVSGLLTGSNVLFNGIRVGEVTRIALNPDAPKEVTATISIDPATPVRADTVVSVDFQGLTGAPVIELSGGDPAAPPLAAKDGDIPLLVASPEGSRSLTQSARATLQRLDKIMDDNSAALHDAIAGISTFAGVLSRNSERIDGILAGLERFAGGAKAKPGIYDLSAWQGKPLCDAPTRPQLVVPEPTSPMAFNSDRVVITGDPPEDAPFEKAQFTDNMPAIVQAKIIESVEHTGCFAAVTRPLDSLEPNDQLQVEIRRFAVALTPQPTADVELSVKFVAAGGKITGSRVFHESATLAARDAPAAVAALDATFGKVLAEAVPWLAGLPPAPRPERKDEPAGDDDFPEPPAP